MKPSVSIVIPAYNESDRLIAPLRSLLEFARSAGDIEIIVVDAGSSDGTREIAAGIMAESPDIPTKSIGYDQNRGKGFAVRTGLMAAAADTALFTDADL